jgi:hypothetical protein
MMAWLLCAWMAAAAPAADDAGAQRARKAEVLRLSDQMTRFAADGKRAGVERTYQQLIALDPKIDPALHVLAAQAAQERGDALLTLARLQRVPAGAPAQADAATTLDGLLTRYGYVRISAPVGTRMQGPAMFSPMERAAIAFAAQVVSDEGHFLGLLPEGAYVVGDQPMEVVAARTANAVVQGD